MCRPSFTCYLHSSPVPRLGAKQAFCANGFRTTWRETAVGYKECRRFLQRSFTRYRFACIRFSPTCRCTTYGRLTYQCTATALRFVDYAVLHGFNRSVPKMDYLSGHTAKNSCKLGSEYLTNAIGRAKAVQRETLGWGTPTSHAGPLWPGLSRLSDIPIPACTNFSQYGRIDNPFSERID